jgi:hypothetical protein
MPKNPEQLKFLENTWSGVLSMAFRIVGKAVANPSPVPTEETLLAGMYVFEHGFALHQCYWNDRFCIAVMLGLPWDLQQKAAWCALNNGLTEYWEWRTHHGYDVARVLKHIGIESGSGLGRNERGYFYLDGDVARQIAEHFSLPSERLRGVKFARTPELERRLNRLWEGYCHEHKLY